MDIADTAMSQEAPVAKAWNRQAMVARGWLAGRRPIDENRLAPLMGRYAA
jgi:hypothetical protein